MALSILDGNQSATTLSTVLSSGQHITAHTVVSLGTQAITDMRGAVSGSVVSISNLPATQPVSIASVTIGNTVTIAGTVTANPTGTQTIAGTVTANAFGKYVSGSENLQIPIIYYDEDISDATGQQIVVPVQINNSGGMIGSANPLPISGTVTIGSALPAGTNRIGVVTIGAGTVTIGAGTAQIGSVTASLQASSITGSLKSLTYQDISTVAYLNVAVGSLPALAAGTAQIGSVTASISGTVPISISSVTVGNSVTIGSLPALAAGTAQIGSVTASISGTVPISISSVTIGNSVTIGSLPAISGTVTVNPSISSSSITSGSFTSLSSATLVPANTARKMATVYNLGAGQLFVNAGATATTLGGGFMVALSSGDFYECNYTTTTLSAIFATAGTASWISH